MTTYGQHDDRTHVDDSAEETQRFPFPAQRFSSEYDDEEPASQEPLFSHERQYDLYGGTNWGAGFFGAVVTVTVGVALTALVAGAATLLGVRPQGLEEGAVQAPTPVLVGVVAVLLGVAAASCYTGGYVAGRMSRFDGGRQGFASWLLVVVISLVAAGSAFLMLARTGVLATGDPLAVPRPDGSPLTWAAGAAAVLLLGSLLAAVGGGKVGRRYHRKVDEAGYL